MNEADADFELRRMFLGFGGAIAILIFVYAVRAVKIVHRQTFERVEHFEREFKGLQKFEPISRSHGGLVDILQIGRDDAAGYFYYVMELADDAAGNPKPEIRNPKETRNPNGGPAAASDPLSDFELRISFVLRHSSFGFLHTSHPQARTPATRPPAGARMHRDRPLAHHRAGASARARPGASRHQAIEHYFRERAAQTR